MEAKATATKVKSPLRYPGGKSRAVKEIRQYLPDGIKELASPFIGGGSIEVSCALSGIKVYGADLDSNLVAFWQTAIHNQVALSRRVSEYYPLEKEAFYALQDGIESMVEPLEIAAAYFVLNRCSFSGTTLSGGMSPGHPRFNQGAIDRLSKFRCGNLSVVHADYKTTMERHRDKFLYLDPPYANNEKLYGKKGCFHDGFDHEELASELKRRGGWVMSYNDSPEIRALYAGYEILTPSWSYGMSGDKKSKEVLILGR